MRMTTAIPVTLLCAVFALHAHRASAGEDAVIDSGSGAFAKLPIKPLNQRVAVAIYEFHVGVPDVTVAAATDMFTTALVDSHQFRVVERNRLNQGVLYEKQINGAGQTTGDVAQQKLRGAQYLFEGTVSEANAGQNQNQGGVSIGGLSIGGGRNKDVIAVDVRILDAATGDVLDSVRATKALKDTSGSVAGTAAFANTIASLRGKSTSALTPDVQVQTAHKESIDKALRACIEAAVLGLIQRTQGSPAS